AEVRDEQDELRVKYGARHERAILTYEQAKANPLQTDWDTVEIAVPWFVGTRVLENEPLEKIVPFIDWTFFFSAWDLKGRFPAIFDHPYYGATARDLYDNAQALL